MGERRLIEITSAVSKLENSLDIMEYISELKESDLYLFLKYVGSSKYQGMSLSDAIHSFSCDYLESKGMNKYSCEEETKKNETAIQYDVYRIVMMNC